MSACLAPTTEPLAPPPPWSALLGRFYSRTGLPLPRLRAVPGSEVPDPYRALLVHSTDMTPTLERFYRQPIQLTVLGRERQDQAYWREVVLHRADEERPVEYGVIRIYLDHLPPDAAKRVVEEGRPFGNILETEAIPHLSWPQAFFSMSSDQRLATLLRLAEPATLYGRRNVLVDGSRRLLAEVIEILAPI